VEINEAAPGAPAVVLLDGMRSRRVQLAMSLRAAGCLVLDTAQEDLAARTLVAGKQSWVLLVVDGSASNAFCEGFPATPIVQIGSRHERAISGRVTIAAFPALSAQLHGLVPQHEPGPN
jgi:hypothetical protein